MTIAMLLRNTVIAADARLSALNTACRALLGDFVANVRTVLYRCAIPSRMRVSQGEDASWQKAP